MMLFYLKFLLLTLACELPLLAWHFRGRNLGLALLIGTLMNLLTNPLLNFLLVNHGHNLWLLEFGAFLVEAACLRAFLCGNWRESLGISLVLNGFSLCIGFGLHFLGWI
jgi:hypothetical protein